MIKTIDIETALDYELRSSLWASLLSADWLQRIAARYFAGKVRRKHRRYARSRLAHRYFNGRSTQKETR